MSKREKIIIFPPSENYFSILMYMLLDILSWLTFVKLLNIVYEREITYSIKSNMPSIVGITFYLPLRKKENTAN